MNRSEMLFERAKKVIPGGVNSPVRAFGSVGTYPRFIKKAEGSHIWDADGNEYIDYVCSWGPAILGHSHPKVTEAAFEAVKNGLSFGAATEAEAEMAELISSYVPNAGMVRLVNSGTEAVMSAVRLARGFTGRDKIIKFEGCYHGHSDSMLVSAGSGLMTSGISASSGVTEGTAKDTLTAVYNSAESARELFEANPGQTAAVIVEPAAANMGVVLPEEGFLSSLRALCDEYGALLIFDEVITGFRLAPGGAQQYYGTDCDIVCLGKIIGGGLPVGAYAARREIMSCISPLGSVYQAGTLSGNPVAVSAGLAQLRELCSDTGVYKELKMKSERLFSGMSDIIRRSGREYVLNSAESLGCMFFAGGTIKDYSSAKRSDTKLYSEYFNFMLANGVYLAPSQFEAMFVSCAHSSEDIDRTLFLTEKFLLEEI